MNERVIETAEDALNVLESTCAQNEASVVRLPSGRTALISPAQGLAALSEALTQPSYREMLRKAAAEFAEGKVEPFEP